MVWGLHLIVGASMFAIGSAVGSFLNVCIYRIPWQKSVVWPASRCPRCLGAIAARDNVPVLSWLALRGECRHCGAPISARYPRVEALVGLLFVGVYATDVAWGSGGLLRALPVVPVLRMAYHLTLVSLLVAAAFIDFDLYIIPDEVTVTGMVLGIVLGALMPEARPDPSYAVTHGQGLWIGLKGSLAGGGLIWATRILGVGVARWVGREEAMGLGDLTLMAMIGAFLGWQATILTLFLGSFLGLAQALFRLVKIVIKFLRGRKIKGSEHEIPFGPYLSMAAVVLVLGWPWIWSGRASLMFQALAELPVVISYLMGWEG